MPANDEPTIGEMRRAIARLDNRLNSISAVTPEVFAAEIRTQQEIHQQHRDAVKQLNAVVADNKKDTASELNDLRTWLRWLFTLLVTNFVTLIAMIVTAIITLL